MFEFSDDSDFSFIIPLKTRISKITPALKARANDTFAMKYLESIGVTPTPQNMKNLFKQMTGEIKVLPSNQTGHTFDSLFVSGTIHKRKEKPQSNLVGQDEFTAMILGEDLITMYQRKPLENAKERLKNVLTKINKTQANITNTNHGQVNKIMALRENFLFGIPGFNKIILTKMVELSHADHSQGYSASKKHKKNNKTQSLRDGKGNSNFLPEKGHLDCFNVQSLRKMFTLKDLEGFLSFQRKEFSKLVIHEYDCPLSFNYLSDSSSFFYLEHRKPDEGFTMSLCYRVIMSFFLFEPIQSLLQKSIILANFESVANLLVHELSVSTIYCLVQHVYLEFMHKFAKVQTKQSLIDSQYALSEALVGIHSFKRFILSNSSFPLSSFFSFYLLCITFTTEAILHIFIPSPLIHQDIQNQEYDIDFANPASKFISATAHVKQLVDSMGQNPGNFELATTLLNEDQWETIWPELESYVLSQLDSTSSFSIVELFPSLVIDDRPWIKQRQQTHNRRMGWKNFTSESSEMKQLKILNHNNDELNHIKQNLFDLAQANASNPISMNDILYTNLETHPNGISLPISTENSDKKVIRKKSGKRNITSRLHQDLSERLLPHLDEESKESEQIIRLKNERISSRSGSSKSHLSSANTQPNSTSGVRGPSKSRFNYPLNNLPSLNNFEII
eukprot:TRINITY_DN3042_c0_g1_i1.p1 TRINITY_DN3042_c0_g1~~TRINITY_DN3042_c0_g1_i1.p1  ORF type:complete len:676 (-),score=138.79 TRINITY_DN3042_c0_g1_i1:13-2040(-)